MELMICSSIAEFCDVNEVTGGGGRLLICCIVTLVFRQCTLTKTIMRHNCLGAWLKNAVLSNEFETTMHQISRQFGKKLDEYPIIHIRFLSGFVCNLHYKTSKHAFLMCWGSE